jgi:LemA protein
MDFWTIVLIAIVVIYVIVVYNSLIGLRNRIKESFSAIDVYLQNRFDSLTKVAEAVVSYAKHERETLAEVTRIRAGIDSNAQSLSDKIKAYSDLDKALQRINIQAENYPDLKASKNYLHLQHTINDLEEKLSASRRTFNANVAAYNTKIASFPALIIARLFGFKPESLLEIEESKKVDTTLKMAE